MDDEKRFHLLQHLILFQHKISFRNPFLFGDEQQLIN